MILSAQSIHMACWSVGCMIIHSVTGEEIPLRSPLLSPFIRRTRHDPSGTSYGLSAAGYDLRLDVDAIGHSSIQLEPRCFLLASTIESFCMPDFLIGFVKDKSSLARRGVSVFNTVIESGWGPKEPGGLNTLTLEIVNHGREPVTLHHGQGIAQVVFQLLDRPTSQPYGPDEKYSGQGRGPVGAR